MVRRLLLCALSVLALPAGAQTMGPSAVSGPRADVERQILVTVDNPRTQRSLRAGSTPKSYGGTSARYEVSPQARRSIERLEVRYPLKRLAEWPIDALGVHCAVFTITTADVRDAVLARLRSDPEVESAQPMQTFAVRTGGAYDDPYFDLQPGLAAMDIAGAHRRSRGENVRVAIVDTGIDQGHPDLAGRIEEYVNLVDDAVPPVESHGTAVAGVIAAAANNGEGIVGVAPSARLLILRACWQSETKQAGDSATCNSFTLARALSRAIEDRAAVINLSLAGPADVLLSRLLDRAIANGAIVVGAETEDPGSPDRFPASVPGVIGVRSAEWPDAGSGICAPGRNVLTLRPDGRYDFENGSSLAAAQISGIVALLRARNPRLKHEQALSLLEQSRASPETPACLVNACAALAHMIDGSACNTVVPTGRELAKIRPD
jgi:hypothetical protein